MSKHIQSVKCRGSALVITLIFSVAAFAGVGALLNLQYSGHKMNQLNFQGQKAFYLAESGRKIAMAELAHTDDPFTGTGGYTWVSGAFTTPPRGHPSAGGNLYRLTVPVGVNDEIQITVDYDDVNNKAVIYSSGLHQNAVKTVRVDAVDSADNPNAGMPTVPPTSPYPFLVL